MDLKVVIFGMSINKMSVVKQALNRIHNANLRREAWEKKTFEEIMNPLPVIEEEYNCEQEFSEFDALLRRNWFVDDDSILDVVWDATEEAFEKIMENVHTYPERVQRVLTNTFNPTFDRISKKTTKDLTDDDMYMLEDRNQKEIDDRLESEWQAYRKENGLSRPESDADERYTELYTRLQTTKRDLEEEMKKPASKRYVPPSMRDKTPATVTPEVEKLQKAIQTLENEISRVKKEIVNEEYIWENDKRTQYKYAILNKVFSM